MPAEAVLDRRPNIADVEQFMKELLEADPDLFASALKFVSREAHGFALCPHAVASAAAASSASERIPYRVDGMERELRSCAGHSVPAQKTARAALKLRRAPFPSARLTHESCNTRAGVARNRHRGAETGVRLHFDAFERARLTFPI